MSLTIGFLNRLQVGASFGMQQIFERAPIEFNDKVGFQARFRVLEETKKPAFAIGYDSQGDGMYHEDSGRYDRKSFGFYGVLSKNFGLPLGQLSTHGGINISAERDDDNDPNIFAGFDWEIFSGFSALLDLDAALNDNADNGQFGSGKAYVDFALRVIYGENLGMMLIFTDLTKNFTGASRSGREFEIAFVSSF